MIKEELIRVQTPYDLVVATLEAFKTNLILGLPLPTCTWYRTGEFKCCYIHIALSVTYKIHLAWAEHFDKKYEIRKMVNHLGYTGAMLLTIPWIVILMYYEKIDPRSVPLPDFVIEEFIKETLDSYGLN